MPNSNNISQPISIFGAGRSGTTLLLNLITATEVVQNCNETLNLVLGCWSGADFSRFSSDNDNGNDSHYEILPLAVHGSLLNSMPSSKNYWVQKLGGIPNVFNWSGKISDNDKNNFNDLYLFPADYVKYCFEHCFPNSMNILLYRDPLQIALSRNFFSGWQRKDVLLDLAVIFRFYESLKEKFTLIIDYDILKKAEPIFIKKLINKLGLQYSDKIMNVFSYRMVPTPGYESGITESIVASNLLNNPLDFDEKKYIKSILESFIKIGINTNLETYSLYNI